MIYTNYIQNVSHILTNVLQNVSDIWHTFVHKMYTKCIQFLSGLVFIWSCPDGLDKSCKYRGQLSLKNLKVLEQMHWLNLS